MSTSSRPGHSRGRWIIVVASLMMVAGLGLIGYNLKVNNFRLGSANTAASLPVPSPSAPVSPSASPTPTPSPTPKKPKASKVPDKPLTDKHRTTDMRCGNSTGKVMLTFDDQGSEAHVRKIMQTLLDHGVGGMFFPTGNWAKQNPQLIQDMRDAGFYVGNHSWSHPEGLADMPVAKQKIQLEKGVESNYFRPPGGSYDERLRQMILDAGMHPCMWGAGDDPKDYQGPSAKFITQYVVRNARPGSVVLLHMLDHTHTLEALPGIIKGVQKKKNLELCAPAGEPTTTKIPFPIKHC